MEVKVLSLYVYVAVALWLFEGLPARAESYTVTVPSGLSLIGNHLNRGSNTVGEVLGNVPDGTVFTKWNNTTRSTEPTNIFRALMGGWMLPEQTLQPGEGAWLKNPGPPFTVTMEGVPAPPSLPVALSQELVLVCRQKVATGTFEQITGRRPTEDTVVYRYFDGIGWLNYTFLTGIGWDPYPPKIPVGEAVFVYCESCRSLAPRPPELLSLLPADHSTNARDAKLLMRLRDPDGQIISGSITARLDQAEVEAPIISVPAPGDSAYAWQPSSLLSTGMHAAQVSFQVAGFTEYDFNIPATTFTTNLSFCVQLRPFSLIEVSPATGSTNAANAPFSFRWSDPDSQVDVTSIVLRVDAVIATNASFQRVSDLVLGVHQVNSPLAAGLHTLELTYSNASLPAGSYTNQIVFYTRPPPQLHLNWSGDTCAITWDGEGRLQESEDLVVWADVKSAPKPYLTGPVGQRKFFRIIEP
jgi:hypothetical protein